MSLPTRIAYFEAYDESGDVTYSGPLEESRTRRRNFVDVLSFYADGHPYVHAIAVREFTELGYRDYPIPVNRDQDRLDSWHERNGRERPSD